MPVSEAEVNLHRLAENEYSGRGFVVGRTPDGNKNVVIYWLTGRSESSRNRWLKINSPRRGSVRTCAYDPKKIKHPDLELYTAIREVSNDQGIDQIVSNGAQTDAIAKFIRAGGYYLGDALKDWSYEPDAPHNTPRISAVVHYRHRDRHWARFSILRKDPSENPNYAEQINTGFGRMVHTYEGDGNPLPSFQGGPRIVPIHDSFADEIADTYWRRLHPTNKVALVTKAIALKSGQVDWAVINKRPDGALERYSLVSPLQSST